MTKRPELSFDGCGINGPDEFRTRVATFNRTSYTTEQVKRYGALFATSPEMAASLIDLESIVTALWSNTHARSEYGWDKDDAEALERARAIIEKVKP